MEKSLILFCFVTILSLQCSKNIFGPNKHEVDYRVSGRADDVKIIYSRNKDIQIDLHSTLPWSHKFKAYDGDWLYLRTVIESNPGNITLVVAVDGKQVLFAKSENEKVDIFISREL